MSGQVAHEHQVQRFFDGQAAAWNRKSGEDPAIRTRPDLFADALARHGVTTGSVLDLGCGTGRVARVLAARGYRVIGADVSERMLEVARATASGEEVTWARQDPQRPFPLPFRDEEFDAVVCSSVLEYLKDPTYALLEMKRILRPGGWAFFTVPDPRHPVRSRERRRQLALRLPLVGSLVRQNPRGRSYAEYLHLSINRYPPATWVTLAEAAGLRPVPTGPGRDALALIEAER